jgi:hypothetical protein
MFNLVLSDKLLRSRLVRLVDTNDASREGLAEDRPSEFLNSTADANLLADRLTGIVVTPESSVIPPLRTNSFSPPYRLRRGG